MQLKEEKNPQRVMQKHKKYKKYHSNGTLNKFKKDDIVVWRGSTYQAIKDVSGHDPHAGEDYGWRELTNENIIQHTTGTVPPPSPNDGDEWVDVSTGILMKYVNDGTTKQWVEL